MDQGIVQPLISKPLYDPTYLSIEYVFNRIVQFFQQSWPFVAFILSLLAIICIALIFYSMIRMREIQAHEKEEIEHEIHMALMRDQEADRDQNPRWHYILTLIESPNESDWRVAIIEADTMLDESLEERGFTGETVSERLEAAKGSGIANLQDAWDAHLVRNQIAHEGRDFSLTQVEGRRIIKMFQNVFEELGVI